MITLSTPPAIRAVLGGATTVDYDKFVLSQIVYDPPAGTINGLVRLTSTAESSMTPILGRFTIASGFLQIEVEQLGVYRRVSLDTNAQSEVAGYIGSAQNALETGMVSLGVIAGVHSPGV
jgi:hypothetical protein